MCHAYFREGVCRHGDCCHKKHCPEWKSIAPLLEEAPTRDSQATVERYLDERAKEYCCPPPHFRFGFNANLVSRNQLNTLRQWTWTCNLQRQWDWTPFKAAVFFDLGNVLSSLTGTQLQDLLWNVTGEDMIGVGVYICTYGRSRWKSLLEDADLRRFARGIDGVIVNYHFDQQPASDTGVLEISSPPTVPPHFLFVEGDKGDCASLLPFPVLLIDDKMKNLRDVVRKAYPGSYGIMVDTPQNWNDSWDWQTTVHEVDTWIRLIHRWLQGLTGRQEPESDE